MKIIKKLLRNIQNVKRIYIYFYFNKFIYYYKYTCLKYIIVNHAKITEKYNRH